MTKIIAWCELRYLTLAELEALFRRFRQSSGAQRPVRPSAGLCSPASKASATPWRCALPGSRSRERRRFSLSGGRTSGQVCSTMFSSFSPRAKRSRLAATTLQRRSAVASLLLELCGVINTFGNSWNGRRDGRRWARPA